MYKEPQQKGTSSLSSSTQTSQGKVANQPGSQGFLIHTYLELSVARATLVLLHFSHIRVVKHTISKNHHFQKKSLLCWGWDPNVPSHTTYPLLGNACTYTSAEYWIVAPIAPATYPRKPLCESYIICIIFIKLSFFWGEGGHVVRLEIGQNLILYHDVYNNC